MHRAWITLPLVGLLAGAPAGAAGPEPAAHEDAQDIFECMRAHWQRQARPRAVLKLKFAPDASPSFRTPLETLRNAPHSPPGRTKQEQPMRCKRGAAPSETHSASDLVLDPAGLLGNARRYPTTRCVADWPIRRGNQFAVSSKCVGGWTEPVTMHDGVPCGGEQPYEGFLFSTYFQREADAWIRLGDVENGSYLMRGQHRPCPSSSPRT